MASPHLSCRSKYSWQVWIPKGKQEIPGEGERGTKQEARETPQIGMGGALTWDMDLGRKWKATAASQMLCHRGCAKRSFFLSLHFQLGWKCKVSAEPKAYRTLCFCFWRWLCTSLFRMEREELTCPMESQSAEDFSWSEMRTDQKSQGITSPSAKNLLPLTFHHHPSQSNPGQSISSM